VTHGHYRLGKGTPTYRTWQMMRQRCENPKDSHYPEYGARGIAVCERWLKFENFLADMGERPDACTLDRIDTLGDYESSNCRWATASEQMHNRRDNRWLTAFGTTRLIIDWAKSSGVHRRTIYRRLAKGMSPEASISTPDQRRRSADVL
jgi:hypothetical protein